MLVIIVGVQRNGLESHGDNHTTIHDCALCLVIRFTRGALLCHFPES